LRTETVADAEDAAAAFAGESGGCGAVGGWVEEVHCSTVKVEDSGFGGGFLHHGVVLFLLAEARRFGLVVASCCSIAVPFGFQRLCFGFGPLLFSSAHVIDGFEH
jgi:hypothetical protein